MSKRSDDRRIVLGRIETGRVSVGDRVLLSPSNATARVAGIEAQNASAPLTEAVAGKSIRLALDEPLSVERGETLSHEDRPPGRDPTCSGPGCSGLDPHR